MEHWGLWKDSVLHWLRLHGQLKLLVGWVTHSTSLWGVVYFSFPVENVFLFGFGKGACPGFWIAALAAFPGLDPLMLIAKEEEDSLASPWREEIAQPKGQVVIACLANVYCGGDSI